MWALTAPTFASSTLWTPFGVLYKLESYLNPRQQAGPSHLTMTQLAHLTCTDRERLMRPASENGTSILACEHKSERVVDAAESESVRHLQANRQSLSKHAEARVSLLTPLPVCVHCQWDAKPAKFSTFRVILRVLPFGSLLDNIVVPRNHTVSSMRRNHCDVEGCGLALRPRGHKNVSGAREIVVRSTPLHARTQASDRSKLHQSIAHTVVTSSDVAAAAASQLVVPHKVQSSTAVPDGAASISV